MAKLVVKICIAIFLAFSATIVVYHQTHVSAAVWNNNLAYHPMVPPFMDYLVIFCVLLLAFFLQVLLTDFKVSINYTPLIIIIGFLIGMLCYHSDILRLMFRVANIPAMELMFVYFPVVLFNISFCVDVFLLVKTLPQIVVIGVFVSLFTAAIFGTMAKFILDPSWLIRYGLLFGVFCSPIYPKSITGLLKHQSSRTRQISVLLEGEALFTLVIADITQKLVLSSLSGLVIHWYQFVMIIVRFITIGPLSGYIFGKISRYLFRKMYSSSIFVVCFALPMLTYALTEYYACGCGSIAVVFLGAMLGLERTVLTKQIENFLVEFWEVAGFALDAIVCFMSAVVAGDYVLTYISVSDYVVAFGIYLAHYIVRFVSFLLFSPITSRLGYGMDIKNMIVCVWCGLKSPFSLQIVGALEQQNFKVHIAALFYFNIIVLYFLSTLINGTFTTIIMDFLGLTQISTARQMNMHNCMKHLFNKREKTIHILKMDRFLADTNWPIVLEATNLRHPYQMQLTEEEERSFFYGLKFSYCEECKRDVPLEPTAKEMREMTKEARMRILKAKKMSYSRQYETGMVSKDAIRILSQTVELAMDSTNAAVAVEDLYKKFSEETWFQRFIRKRVEKLRTKPVVIKPPLTYWRRLCYHLVTKRRFEKIMLLIVLLHVGVLVVDIFFHPNMHSKYGEDHSWTLEFAILAPRLLCSAIYIIEFSMKIMAYSWKRIWKHGVHTYFRSFWNIQDFISMIIAVAGSILSVTDLIQRYQAHSETKSQFRKIIEILILTRAFRLLRVFDVFYPDIINYLSRSADKRMSFTYELGKSYATAEAEILDMLPLMIDNKKIRENEQRRMERDKVYITKLLGLVQKERPWIAITVKTKQAIKTILNGMSDSIDILRSSGWADDYEYDQLNASMNDLYQKVNAIKKVQPSPPKVIFKEVSWMADDEVVIDFLFENVTARKFEPGEVVFKEGIVADAIYIVVTGLFMISYIPDAHLIAYLKEYGQLPIVDYISGTKYEEQAVDYIVSGNCIGELSILTSRCYNCVVTADSHSQAYVLPRGVLSRAMELSPDPVNGLQCRIWKEVGIRLSIPLLLAVPAYQGLSQDQAKYTLERAFVPDLSKFKIFAVTDAIEDIILIEGIVSDFNTREVYTAPTYIPRTVQKLILPVSSLISLPFDVETKLLIIPAKDVDEYDVMMMAEETCEMVATSATKCIQHVIQKRMRRQRMSDAGRRISLQKRGVRGVRSLAYSASGEMAQPSGYTFFKEVKSETNSIYMAADEMATKEAK